LSGEAGPTTDPDGTEVETSRLAKWAVVVIVGEVSLLLFVLVLGTIPNLGNPATFIAAFMLAILIGGRVGGVRGAVQWLIAAVLIVAVALVSLYLLIGLVVSQMTGP
jgi:hypothetical protein